MTVTPVLPSLSGFPCLKLNCQPACSILGLEGFPLLSPWLILTTDHPRERAPRKPTYLVWFFPRIGLSFGHNDRPNHTSRLQVVTSFDQICLRHAFNKLATPNQNDNMFTWHSRSSLAISREQIIPSIKARFKRKQSPKLSNNSYTESMFDVCSILRYHRE